MSYIILHENETLPQALDSRTKTATEPVECYKVIEERMSGSGRTEYWTYPLYDELNEDIVTGKVFQHPQGELNLHVEPDGRVPLNSGFIHTYKTYEDALEFMMEHGCFGYTETRPVVYKCVIPTGENYIECHNKHTKDSKAYPGYVTSHLQYVKPLTQKTWGREKPYAKMEKPEFKKKKFGIIYDESQINGEVNFESDE